MGVLDEAAIFIRAWESGDRSTEVARGCCARLSDFVRGWCLKSIFATVDLRGSRRPSGFSRSIGWARVVEKINAAGHFEPTWFQIWDNSRAWAQIVFEMDAHLGEEGAGSRAWLLVLASEDFDRDGSSIQQVLRAIGAAGSDSHRTFGLLGTYLRILRDSFGQDRLGTEEDALGTSTSPREARRDLHLFDAIMRFSRDHDESICLHCLLDEFEGIPFIERGVSDFLLGDIWARKVTQLRAPEDLPPPRSLSARIRLIAMPRLASDASLACPEYPGTKGMLHLLDLELACEFLLREADECLLDLASDRAGLPFWMHLELQAIERHLDLLQGLSNRFSEYYRMLAEHFFDEEWLGSDAILDLPYYESGELSQLNRLLTCASERRRSGPELDRVEVSPAMLKELGVTSAAELIQEYVHAMSRIDTLSLDLEEVRSKLKSLELEADSGKMASSERDELKARVNSLSAEIETIQASAAAAKVHAEVMDRMFDELNTWYQRFESLLLTAVAGEYGCEPKHLRAEIERDLANSGFKPRLPPRRWGPELGDYLTLHEGEWLVVARKRLRTCFVEDANLRPDAPNYRLREPLRRVINTRNASTGHKHLPSIYKVKSFVEKVELIARLHTPREDLRALCTDEGLRVLFSPTEPPSS